MNGSNGLSADGKPPHGRKTSWALSFSRRRRVPWFVPHPNSRFTALLVASVFALADRGEGRFRWRLGLPPFAVGLSTYVIGPWSGSSLNPARTLAPAVVAGVYTDVWVYLVAVPLGALIVGALWKPRSVDRLDRGPGRTDSIA